MSREQRPPTGPASPDGLSPCRSLQLAVNPTPSSTHRASQSLMGFTVSPASLPDRSPLACKREGWVGKVRVLEQ